MFSLEKASLTQDREEKQIAPEKLEKGVRETGRAWLKYDQRF